MDENSKNVSVATNERPAIKSQQKNKEKINLKIGIRKSPGCCQSSKV